MTNKMTKVVGTIVVIVLTVVAIAGLVRYTNHTEISYINKCQLYDVEDDVITVEDEDGNLWAYESEDVPKAFATIILYMNDNGTEDITDDTILAIAEQ